ncbi:hypothetical protein FGB62_15g08 [Gracilaria domingensis]|nr:hypothetical protein FGB62_15g08 [Gracilaria domingensis]
MPSRPAETAVMESDTRLSFPSLPVFDNFYSVLVEKDHMSDSSNNRSIDSTQAEQSHDSHDEELCWEPRFHSPTHVSLEVFQFFLRFEDADERLYERKKDNQQTED